MGANGYVSKPIVPAALAAALAAASGGPESGAADEAPGPGDLDDVGGGDSSPFRGLIDSFKDET
jgi:hypothetical protein